jgi:hypothetical protein
MRRIVLLLLTIALLGLPAGAEAAGAKPGKALFAHGTSPSGEHWSAEASVSVNRRTDSWRFNIGFRFSLGFKWGSGQEIPIGGHKKMTGQASGYTGILTADAPESAAFGYAGPEVTTIKMKMSDGSSVKVHPVFPPEQLRRRFVWMRGFRYFMQYYPGGAYVTEYWLYDSAGKRVGCETYAEGELGPSVCGTPPIVN